MILGIDEVGRGPWAGPLVVGAVILGKDFPRDINLTDSKKLTAKKREVLEPFILEKSLACGLGWVSTAELDQYGLSASLKLATRRAVKEVLQQLSAQKVQKAQRIQKTNNLENTKTTQINITHSENIPNLEIPQIIIDGTINFLKGTPLEDRVETLPKADLLVREVSAASIIAKVARDRYMTKIALQYPIYGFEKHVGYGTALHQKALLEHGVCPEHRKSFRPIRKILEKSPQNLLNSIQLPQKSSNTPLEPSRNTEKSTSPSSSQKGQTAELAVAEHLTAQNHRIIAHNFKTKTYEIDLISLKNRQIFFTEVKYSHNSHIEGTPLVRITPKKLQQMYFAAEHFLGSHPKYQKLNPALATASVSGPNYQVEDWFVLV